MALEGYQNRRSPKGGPEDFPTPPWATRAMLTHILPDIGQGQTVWEPAANRGYMARPLAERFSTVIASDLIDYGAGYPVVDFLNGPSPSDFGQPVDWIITNPPFNLATEFALRALDVAREGVALLLRSAWAEGHDRHTRLFSQRPPAIIAQHVTRVPIVRGRVDKKAVSAMPYAWFIWRKGSTETTFRWIPHCRKEMERDGDYPAAEQETENV